MPSPDLTANGAHTMTVCNSCRYCEQYCPVFPAIERRTTFAVADLEFLANLCHSCGECLYACQYAPPHVFAIDVPRMFAEIRLASYEAHCWPRPLARAFRWQGLVTSTGLAVVFATLLAVGTVALNPGGLSSSRADAEFYAVVPHGVMVTMFGAVGAFVLAALALATRSYARLAAGDHASVSAAAVFTALRDGLSLKHLHGAGHDCVSAEESRSSWRRWGHHLTAGGFALSFASTSVAAFYHSVLGVTAPYGYGSLPVVLGTLGGLGLVVGPVVQSWQRRRQDPALRDPAQSGLDSGFVWLLWLTAATGLALLILRHTAAMPWLLVGHLGVVLALFVSLPYGKFVHGWFRAAALALDAAEREAEAHRRGRASTSAA
jgi:citrate/tricarballylate utilization protein